jgi:hypothetical protein
MSAIGVGNGGMRIHVNATTKARTLRAATARTFMVSNVALERRRDALPANEAD